MGGTYLEMPTDPSGGGETLTARDDLLALVPPPSRPAVVPDWAAVEARLGTRLPGDYKWLIETYGSGSFDEFLGVFQPGSRIDGLRLEHQAERTAWALDYLRDGGEQVPFRNDELLPFGRTDNGDFCYWVRHPADDPDAWTVVVNEARGPEWSAFDGGGAVAFLSMVLSGGHRVSVFPDDFPGAHPAFEPDEA
ncbi:SMI1/KNR4 family protein [Jidongwangia harbinensis]|uniref:SMI1/KNR4 family protein n=1 Tax=Jidongwangia harbinensis TaxID=2878561 RepID=UPI001CD9A358|nr:SMI1/KNR4 family protein [Jidongwangia harbinensis]MCA2217153.1 SMI1/KNR4 family protein [Jidongwangia harbinensis]